MNVGEKRGSMARNASDFVPELNAFRIKWEKERAKQMISNNAETRKYSEFQLRESFSFHSHVKENFVKINIF